MPVSVLPFLFTTSLQEPGSKEERANDLGKELTLEEKAALMQNTSPAIPRLGIKAYDWWNEALHGVGRAGLAHCIPESHRYGSFFQQRTAFTMYSPQFRMKHVPRIPNSAKKAN